MTIIGKIILLSVMKLFAGIIAHSNAMISDAIHSASDVFSTFIVMIGGLNCLLKKLTRSIRMGMNVWNVWRQSSCPLFCSHYRAWNRFERIKNVTQGRL